MSNQDTTSEQGVYVPGRAGRKLMVIVYGVILLLLGGSMLWSPLWLFASGARERAETVAVIKSKKGLPDLLLKDDSQVQAGLEPRDRSYVFWNVFLFHTPDGRTFEVRSPVGSQLKPLHPLLDEDGLPTTELICYDASDPSRFVFPALISTWFVPGMLVASGLACILIGSVLLYWAKRPIALPHLPAKNP